MSTDRMDDRFVIIDLRTFGIETLGTDPPHYVLVLRARCLARKVFLGLDKQGLLGIKEWIAGYKGMAKSEGLAADFLARFARLVAFWLDMH